ncbi:MAG: GtrA family protein [Candidatus Woesearchaeota archaeon]
MKKFVDEILTYDRILKAYPIYGTLRRYFIFLLGGGTGLLIAEVTTTLLTESFQLWYMLSYIIGTILAIIFTFIYHRYVTFRKFTDVRKRFVKFVFVVSIIAVVNIALVYLSTEAVAGYFGTEVTKFYYWATIFIVTLVLSTVNFTVNKLWVFK